MNHATRAKLFVSAVNTTANVISEDDYDRGVVAPTFGVVTLTPVYSPRPDAENHAFFKATPNGRLTLGRSGDDLAALRPGTFWYADVVEDPEGPYALRKADRDGDTDPESDGWGNLYVEIGQYEEHDLRRTSLQMAISNKRAWSTFDRPLGTRYRIDLVPTTKVGT